MTPVMSPNDITSSMTPVTSPNDHCPVKPSSSVQLTAEEDNSESDIDEIDDYGCERLEGYGEGKSYNPEYMEMDGTCDHKIQILLTFTNGVVPENMCNQYIYNGPGSATGDNALNRFHDPLVACAVAGGLHHELISHLIVHSMIESW